MRDKLGLFIDRAKDWPSAHEDSEVLALGANFLHHELGVRSGLFVYREWSEAADNTSVACQHWGDPSHQSIDVQALMKSLVKSNVKTRQWISTQKYSTGLTRWAIRCGASFVGIWPLEFRGQNLGFCLLGCNRVDLTDEMVVTVCTMHLSLVLDALRSRYVAEQISCIDSLTGLLNRSGFHHAFPSLLQSSSRAREPLLIGILDLDDFKMINDFYGHLHGDKILHRIAKHLKACIGDRGLCARWGGDEMVFAWRPSVALEKAEASLVESLSPSLTGCYVSIGSAVWGIDGDEWNLCLSSADQRLYEKKLRRASRNDMLNIPLH